MEIKPCPFCGSMAELRTTRSPYNDKHFTFVRCISCYGTSGSIATHGEPADVIKQRAVREWNRRSREN